MSHVVAARLAIHASMFLARTKAEEASQSRTERGVDLGGQYLFKGGLITSLYVTRAWQDRDASSGLFINPRKDDRWSLTGRIRHRNLTLRGLAPTLELTYEVQGSSIPLYEYRNIGVAFGLSRDF
ncbi:surface lipoprotein assembly modifier [Paracoccus liaowanqingii]|nr:surface lipoprotein assembly modifier [Paracoccus liaowanqingii]